MVLRAQKETSKEINMWCPVILIFFALFSPVVCVSAETESKIGPYKIMLFTCKKSADAIFNTEICLVILDYNN